MLSSMLVVATEGAWVRLDPRFRAPVRSSAGSTHRTSTPLAKDDSFNPLAPLFGDSSNRKDANPLARLFGKKEDQAGPLSSGLDSAIAAAPLPFKIAGALLKPLAGAVDKALADAQDDQDDLLRQARSALRAQPHLEATLGPEIQVGSVLSSSSSSMSVNGQVQRQLQLQFQVLGRGSALAVAQGASSAAQPMLLTRLVVEVGGRQVEVPPLGSSPGADSSDPSNAIVDVDVEVL